MGEHGLYGLRVFSDMCVGCPNCMIACKAFKQITVMDVNPLEIEKVFEETPEGDVKLSFVVKSCQQCEDPKCLEACTDGALTVNEYGVVVVDEEKCTGCKKCVKACPYDAIKYDKVKKSVVKCDLCYERTKRGLQPACVQACPAKVVYVGKVKDIESQIEKRRQEIKNQRERIKKDMETRWSEAGIDVPYFDI